MVTPGSLHGRRDAILAVAARHGASHERLFGSVARGDARPESDVDFLIDLEEGRGLLDLCALENELEDLLGHPVDVALARSLRTRVKERALRDAVPVWGTTVCTSKTHRGDRANREVHRGRSRARGAG